jgi:uncharacterized protein with PIN domain
VKTQISLSIKEIYERLCPECKKKLRELIKEKITEQMVNEIVEKSS